MKRKLSILFLIVLAQFAFYSCSDRIETPTVEKDSTIVYISKSTDGISAQITFCNKISSKTGKPIGEGTVFSIKEKAKLVSVIDLKNISFHRSSGLMFHVDWIDPDENSFYKKRIDIQSGDSSSFITSSISLTPGKRKAGNYNLRVYLFRELIAEKKFQLVDAKSDSLTTEKTKLSINKKKSINKEVKKKAIKPKVKVENISANITLCRGVSKKTGKLLGVDSMFTIKEKRKVKAVVKIENHDIKTNQQMNFYFEWIGPDGKQFYKKKIVYTTSNPAFTISNSISIAPDKRKSGIYSLRVYYKKKIIAEQKFELVEKQIQKKNLITE